MDDKEKDINAKLYDLLKEPLGLHSSCISFTLIVELDALPRVQETYLLTNIDEKLKYTFETHCVERNINELRKNSG